MSTTYEYAHKSYTQVFAASTGRLRLTDDGAKALHRAGLTSGDVRSALGEWRMATTKAFACLSDVKGYSTTAIVGNLEASYYHAESIGFANLEAVRLAIDYIVAGVKRSRGES